MEVILLACLEPFRHAQWSRLSTSQCLQVPSTTLTRSSELGDVRSSRILQTAHVPTWQASMTYTSWGGLSRPWVARAISWLCGLFRGPVHRDWTRIRCSTEAHPEKRMGCQDHGKTTSRSTTTTTPLTPHPHFSPLTHTHTHNTHNTHHTHLLTPKTPPPPPPPPPPP